MSMIFTYVYLTIISIVDMRKGYCFNDYDDRGCSNPRMILSTKQVCCCTRGAGWGDPCDICPVEQTGLISFASIS